MEAASAALVAAALATVVGWPGAWCVFFDMVWVPKKHCRASPAARGWRAANRASINELVLANSNDHMVEGDLKCADVGGTATEPASTQLPRAAAAATCRRGILPWTFACRLVMPLLLLPWQVESCVSQNSVARYEV